MIHDSGLSDSVKVVLNNVAERVESELIDFEQVPEKVQPAISRLHAASSPDAIRLMKRIIGLLRLGKTSHEFLPEEILSKLDSMSVDDKMSLRDYDTLGSLCRVASQYRRPSWMILERLVNLRVPELLEVANGRSSSIETLKIT